MSLSSLAVVLESPFDLNAILLSDELDPKQELVRACLQVMEAIRFEKVRTTSNGSSSVDVRAVLSGVLNTFDIVDLDDEENASVQNSLHDPPPYPLQEQSCEDLTAAASIIQKKWRVSFDYSEKKREQSMQESLATSVIKVIPLIV